MASFDRETIAAAQAAREVQLTTWGRQTGQPHQGTIWIASDGERLYVRSGVGLGRNWARNALAGGRAVLHLAGQDIPAQVRHVTDPAEARAVSTYYAAKYGPDYGPSAPDEPLKPGEEATFELLPAT